MVARALSISHTSVPPTERDDFRRRATRSRACYRSAGCQYWLFEDDAVPGSYVEFVEAPDGDTLRNVLDAALPTYTEVQLS